MKQLLLILCCITLFFSCKNTNPNYERNLATMQSMFELHGQEDLDAQLAMLSKDLDVEVPMYGAENIGYDQFAAMVKGYHDAFDNLNFEASAWLPGSDESGAFDGSVRTYGTWTGTNVLTGKALNLKSYHYANFDDDGLIIGFGDFFDAGGMMDAVYPKNLVVVSLAVQDGNVDNVMEILNSEGGLPTTRAYDGCMSLELTFNEASNTIWIVSNWESNEKYNTYLTWRQTEDTVIASMVPYLKNGADGITIVNSNSNYMAY